MECSNSLGKFLQFPYFSGIMFTLLKFMSTVFYSITVVLQVIASMCSYASMLKLCCILLPQGHCVYSSSISRYFLWPEMHLLRDAWNTPPVIAFLCECLGNVVIQWENKQCPECTRGMPWVAWFSWMCNREECSAVHTDAWHRGCWGQKLHNNIRSLQTNKQLSGLPNAISYPDP